jgi:hypothetical protein
MQSLRAVAKLASVFAAGWVASGCASVAGVGDSQKPPHAIFRVIAMPSEHQPLADVQIFLVRTRGRPLELGKTDAEGLIAIPVALLRKASSFALLACSGAPIFDCGAIPREKLHRITSGWYIINVPAESVY